MHQTSLFFKMSTFGELGLMLLFEIEMNNTNKLKLVIETIFD